MRNQNHILIDGKKCINFCSNDYLGLAEDPCIKKAFMAGVEQYGFGSGSSTFIAGFFKPQAQLEEAFACFLQRDQAIFFNSGYHANIGVISGLAHREHTILSDKFSHASIIDGIQLSRAKHRRFEHNNLTHLASLLSTVPPAFLITEGVFSMEGDIAPLAELAAMAKQANVTLIIDDAHGMAVLGENGGGVCDLFSLTQSDVPCLVAPLGKAFGGVGAIVAGEKSLMEKILQNARSNRYSTALPPAICVALLKSLEMIQGESWRRAQLHHIITFFTLQARQRNLPLMCDDPTPIKCFLTYDNELTEKIQKKLLSERSLFVSCIRPPTVMAGQARIRISLNCFHTEPQILELLDGLAEHLNAHR